MTLPNPGPGYHHVPLLMRPTIRIAVVVLLVPISLGLMTGIVFGVDRATNSGEVLGKVSAADVDVGGLGEDDAMALLLELEDRLAATPVAVSVAGREFTLVPSDVGFDLDEDAILGAALAHGREGSITNQFRWWIGHFGDDNTSLELPYTYNDVELNRVIARWEIEGIDEPPYAGDVQVIDGEVVIDEPRPGTGIDREQAAALVGGALTDHSREPILLPTRLLDPAYTVADLEAVADAAGSLLDGSLALIDEQTYLGTRVIVPETVLAESLRIERDDLASPPRFSFVWDNEPIAQYVASLGDRLATEPIDAELIIEDDDTVTITQSAPVFEPDLGLLADAVRWAASSSDRSATLPFREGAPPTVSTEDLEELGITGKISEFSTFHNCCESRVTNIHLIADAANDAMVMPGETWSLNEHVGQRTADKGYVPAGAIIRGVLYCCDDPINIGGGTSQFATTIYNALFFAGLEDVEHQPHSIYFSRYPEGREATLGWPKPDVIFRNNLDSAVLIRTEHTDTSITVKVFGDNGGIQVEAGLSDRYNFTGPRQVIEYNPDLAPGQEVVTPGSGGWSVDIYRYITHPDGTTTTEEWTWHYSGAFTKIERHPCFRNNTCPTD
jgi:vancomycin resistance protein YoaR